MKWLLPVPLGPQTTSTSCAVDPFQGAQRVLGLACGIAEAVWLPRVERLAGRQPGGACGASGSSPGRGRRPPRRAARAAPRRAPSAGWWRSRSPPAPLGGRRAAQAAQQPVELVGQRRRGGRLDGHRRLRSAPELGLGRRGSVAARSRQDRRSPPSGSVSGSIAEIRWVHRPNPSQLRVERCSERSSGPARERDHARPAAAGGRGSLARSPSANRPARRTRSSASSTWLGAVQLGEIDRFGHLAPDPLRARRGGPLQPPLGARRRSQERPLLALARPGLALQRARRPRRVVLVADARAPRRGQPVAGDLPRPLRPGRRARRPAARRRRGPTPARRSARAGPSRCAPPTLIGRLPVDLAGLPEAQRVRQPRQPVQTLMLLGQQASPAAAGSTRCGRVLTSAMNCSHAASSSAKSAYCVAEVVIGRHQIRLRDPHRRLEPPLLCGSAGTHVAIVSP